MEENVNIMTQQPADDELTRLITERLGERQRKLQQMKQWEMPNRGKVVGLYAGTITLVAAACVAALMVFAPWKAETTAVDEMGIRPDMTEFRSASPDVAEVQALLEKPDYEAAMLRAEKALAKSDMEVYEMKDVADVWENDEMLYEEQLELEMNAQLRWTYIYLLVKNGYDEKAVKQLKKYLKNKEYCAHRTEAQALLKELKKK